MTLAELLAALAARQDDAEAARNALTGASDATIAAGIAQLEYRASELQGIPDDQLTVAVVEEAERVADQLAQLRTARDGRSGLAERRAAAFGVANGHPGSDTEANLPEGSAGRPQMPGENERMPEGGHPPGRPSGNEVAEERGEGAGAAGTGSQGAGGTSGSGTTGTTPQGGAQATAGGGDLNAFREDGGGQAGAAERDGAQREGVTATMRAQTEIPGVPAGQELATLEQFTNAFLARAHSLWGPGGGGAEGRYSVAQVEFSYPESRQLTEDNAVVNTQRIAAVTDARDEQLVAAGGLCAPLDVRYDINVLGVTTRPVRDMLARFQVSRGGIQYRAPWDALQMTEGMGIWTMEEDAEIGDRTTAELTDADPHKTCFIAQCAGTIEALIYSTYMCLEFPNITARFDREWVTAVNQAAQVAWARWSENQLMARLFAASKLVVGRQALSAVRDILSNYDRIISYYRNRHRLSDAIPLHALFPRWVIDMIRTDVARQMNTNDYDAAFAVSQATIESWFRTRNVNVTFHLDGLDGITVNGHAIPDQHYGNKIPGAGDKVPNWPAEVDTLLYTEGDWLLLDGGTMDMGIVRDSELNRRNRYQVFTETFEGVAFMGVESMRVVLPLKPNGAMTGTVQPSQVDSADAAA